MHFYLLFFLFIVSSPLCALERVNLSLGQVEAAWGVAGPVVLRLDLSAPTGSLEAKLDIGALRVAALPGTLGESRDVRLSCPRATWEDGRLGCAALSVRATPALPLLSGKALSLALDVRTSTLRLWGKRQPLAKGWADVDLRWSPSGWTLALEGKALQAGDLLILARSLGLPDAGFTVGSGSVDVSLQVRSDDDGIRIRGVLEHERLAFSDRDSLRAGEGLKGRLRVSALGGNGAWQGTLASKLEAGQAYVDPVLVDMDADPLALKTAFVWKPDQLQLSDVVVRQGGFLSLAAQARRVADQWSVGLDALQLTFPQAFASWVQPWLIEAGLDELETAGALQIQGVLDSRGLQSVVAEFRDVHVEDGKGRFALLGLDGTLAWDRSRNTQSQLQWRAGKLFALDLGVSRLSAHTRQGRFGLTQALKIPLLDGALTLEDLRVGGLDGSEPVEGHLSGYLSPVSMEALSEAFGWPAMGGTFSGMLPELHYENGNLRLEGVLLAQVFDGVVRVRNFRLQRPFSPAPRMLADVEVEGLDMEKLTETYAVGSIEGTLDGTLKGLELSAWKANRFDARFRSRKQDERPHRISRKAVSNLAEVAGGGGGLFQAGGLLGLFDHFAYDELGWTCRLRHGVCHMGGVADRERGGGYYIVRGAWLPRVDVVGHARRVDWPTLLERIANVRVEDFRIE